MNLIAQVFKPDAGAFALLDHQVRNNFGHEGFNHDVGSVNSPSMVAI